MTVLLTLGVLVVEANADVSGIRPGTRQTIAVRGGVLVVPLDARRHGDRWPETLRIRLADGTRLDGRVAWVSTLPDTGARQWTDAAVRLGARPVLPTDDSSIPGAGVAYVVASLPDEGEGDVRIAGQTIQTRWVDRPERIVRARIDTAVPFPSLEERAPEALPDPKTPFEHWRAALIADAVGAPVPDPFFGDELSNLIAQHDADVWAVALHRLDELNPELAGRCRDALVRTAQMDDRPIAAWVTDPGAISTLLTTLVREDVSLRDLQETASRWLDTHVRLVVWPSKDTGDQVEIVILNPTTSWRVVRARWLGVNDVPIAIEAPSGRVTRLIVDRPAFETNPLMPEALAPQPERLTLQLQSDTLVRELRFGARRLVARPPGVWFRALQPVLTLAEVNAQTRRPIGADRSTSVQLRRADRHWEIYVECQRPAPPSADAITGIEYALRWPDLLGTEAITLIFGREIDSRGAIVIVIPEVGPHHLVEGRLPRPLEVHRVSDTDVWRCRIVLPEPWRSDGSTEPMRLAVVRTHYDRDTFELAPGNVVPWAASPSRALIDLTQWPDLPVLTPP